MLSDWTHTPVEELFKEDNFNGYPMDNSLINGTNVYLTGGKRLQMNFKNGTSYRIRLINTSMDTHYQVALDDHIMKVIATDFVPIKPFDTNILAIGIGQRYDVIIEANKGKGDFWFRANVQYGCGSHGPEQKNISAIVRYDPTSTTDPDSTWPPFTDECADMPAASITPVVSIDVPSPGKIDHSVDFLEPLDETTHRYHWEIKGVPYHSPWNYPSRLPIY
jgi:FtsP/CotA-like multicopper oxidase with cupredoxin domain